MPIQQAFYSAGSVSIAASTTSTSAKLPGGGDTVLIVNNTSDLAYVQFGAGTGTPTATASSSVVVPPNSRMATVCGYLANQVAVLLDNGAGTVTIMQGRGDHY